MSRFQLFKPKSIITPPPRFKIPKSIPEMPEEPSSSTTTTTTTTLSPSYLAQTANASHRVQDPSSSRKLLVLDLNGSLLIRARRSTGAKGKEKVFGDESLRSRPVHPRPYIPSFREYISHPKTQSWLDTMVWSSAQPHSVKSMVEKCFGRGTDDYSGLKALMARDMCNLDPAAYARKSLTTKDLDVIWSKNAFVSSPALASMVPDSSNDTHPFSHSSETTVLLDDSLRKARMQPWNHICLTDYVAGMRKADLAVWRSSKGPGKKKKKKKTQKDETDASEENPVVVEIDPQVAEVAPAQPQGKFDETMLAIVGILERLKHESNVGSWIRQGGLLTGGVERELGSENSEAVVLATEETDDHRSIWFNDARVADSWAERGRAALQDLGIDLDHGIND